MNLHHNDDQYYKELEQHLNGMLEACRPTRATRLRRQIKSALSWNWLGMLGAAIAALSWLYPRQ